MQFKMLFPIIIVTFLLFLLTVFNKMFQTEPPKTQPTSITNSSSAFSNSPKVIGWIPYWDQERAKKSFFANHEAFDFISVFWYRIDPDGKVATYKSTAEDQSIIDFAHKNGVKVMAIIANMADYHEPFHGASGWDRARVDKVISTPEAREKHIEEIIYLVESKGFDGIDIDYENLKSYQKENFSIFIEELSREMHKRGKLVGAAVHPKTSEANPAEDSGAHGQDLQRLAIAVDQLYYMTYLEHGTFSPPGPPGSPDWIEKVISYSSDTLGIQKEKIFMGVGLMGVAWRLDPGGTVGDREDMTFEEVLSHAQNSKVEPIWDPASRTPRIEFTDQHGEHIVWFENNPSVTDRLELAKRLGVGGLAFWRIGGEDQQVWDSISR